MKKNYRSGRLGEEIRRIISDLLLRELKDPRITGMVSVTAVDVTNDYSYATVYLSVFKNDIGDEELAEMQESVLEAMESAKGFMRREIGAKIKMRRTPELIFKIDESMEYGRKMDELIDSVMKGKNEE